MSSALRGNILILTMVRFKTVSKFKGFNLKEQLTLMIAKRMNLFHKRALSSSISLKLRGFSISDKQNTGKGLLYLIYNYFEFDVRSFHPHHHQYGQYGNPSRKIGKISVLFIYFVIFIYFRVSKSLACHSPTK